MDPAPDFGTDSYEGHGKLKGKVSTCTLSNVSWLGGDCKIFGTHTVASNTGFN